MISYLTLETNAAVIHDDKFESLGLMQNFGLDLDSVISDFPEISAVVRCHSHKNYGGAMPAF